MNESMGEYTTIKRILSTCFFWVPIINRALNELHIVSTSKSFQDGEDRPMHTELVIMQHDKSCATAISTMLWWHKGECDLLIHPIAVWVGQNSNWAIGGKL